MGFLTVALVVLAACGVAYAGTESVTACVQLVSGPASGATPAGPLRKCVDGTITDAQFDAVENVRPAEIYEVRGARSWGFVARIHT